MLNENPYRPFESGLDAQNYIFRDIADSPRSFVGWTSPLEDQYQEEFYWSFYSVVDGRSLFSLEYFWCTPFSIQSRAKSSSSVD